MVLLTCSIVPPALNAPTLLAAGPQDLTIQWEALTEAQSTGAVLSYTLYLLAPVERNFSIPFPTLNQFVDMLDPATEHTFEVSATTSAGEGERSPNSTFTTLDAGMPCVVFLKLTTRLAPGPPDAPVVTSVSSTELLVSWADPPQPNGNITSFELFQVDNMTLTSLVSGLVREFSVTGLTPNTNFDFVVQATTIETGNASEIGSGSTAEAGTAEHNCMFTDVD